MMQEVKNKKERKTLNEAEKRERMRMWMKNDERKTKVGRLMVGGEGGFYSHVGGESFNENNRQSLFPLPQDVPSGWTSPLTDGRCDGNAHDRASREWHERSRK